MFVYRILVCCFQAMVVCCMRRMMVGQGSVCATVHTWGVSPASAGQYWGPSFTNQHEELSKEFEMATSEATLRQQLLKVICLSHFIGSTHRPRLPVRRHATFRLPKPGYTCQMFSRFFQYILTVHFLHPPKLDMGLEPIEGSQSSSTAMFRGESMSTFGGTKTKH